MQEIGMGEKILNHKLHIIKVFYTQEHEALFFLCVTAN